jgi:hypothetical protein
MADDKARGQLVIFGTAYASGDLPSGMGQPRSVTSETWTWRTGKWTKLAPATSPPPRPWAGMAYDEARHQIVLFGGGRYKGSVLQDTWTWDGKNWSRRTPVTSPPAASGPILLYDAKLSRVVALVDASDSTDAVTQTWTWDGNTWAQLHPSIELPGPRAAAGAAYDAAHGTIVAVGRIVCADALTCPSNNDTWTFDGKTWAQHPTPAGGPPSRVGATMAYDPSTGKVVMFGGAVGPATLGNFRDTWTWDGNAWIQAHPVDSPWARTFARATTDTAAGQVVLYGGYAVSGDVALSYSDVWTWTHGSWTLVQPTTIPAPADERDVILEAASAGLRPSCTGASPPCMSVRGEPQLGFYAAYVVFDLNPAQGQNASCIAYVSYVGQAFASGPWHQVGVVCAPSDQMLKLGAPAKVTVAGCANVRAFPLTGAVVSCLPNGTSVTIDDGPFAVAGDSKRLWWHLQQRGWMAHELLVAGGGA